MLAQMSGPGVPGREGLRQAEAGGSWEREHQESLWQFSVAISGGGGNDVLISQIINKCMLFIKNMDHLLIANHDIYLFRLCPYIYYIDIDALTCIKI